MSSTSLGAPASPIFPVRRPIDLNLKVLHARILETVAQNPLVCAIDLHLLLVQIDKNLRAILIPFELHGADTIQVIVTNPVDELLILLWIHSEGECA